MHRLPETLDLTLSLAELPLRDSFAHSGLGKDVERVEKPPISSPQRWRDSLDERCRLQDQYGHRSLNLVSLGNFISRMFLVAALAMLCTSLFHTS